MPGVESNANAGLDLDDLMAADLAKVSLIFPNFCTDHSRYHLVSFLFLESLSYNIEVVTTSESREEITVVRLSPKAVERGLQETLRKNFKV